MLKYLPLLALAACATPSLDAGVYPADKRFAAVLEREPIGNAYTVADCQSMQRIEDNYDEWYTPSEFFNRGGGDCEDFAICTYYALRSQGVSEHAVSLVLTSDHAVTHYGNTIYDVDKQYEADTWLKLERPLYRSNEYYGQIYVGAL